MSQTNLLKQKKNEKNCTETNGMLYADADCWMINIFIKRENEQ